MKRYKKIVLSVAAIIALISAALIYYKEGFIYGSLIVVICLIGSILVSLISTKFPKEDTD